MYYHVRISTKSNPKEDEAKVDYTHELLNERIIKPYEEGKPIFINGKNINGDDLTRIRISCSDSSSEKIIQQLKYEDSNSSIISMGGPDYPWRVANRANDITDEIILGGFGYKKDYIKNEDKNKKIDESKVFIVHGHDELAKIETARFIEQLKLNPVILHEQVNAGQTIIEKIENNSDVGFGIVLYTPCDIGAKVDNKDNLTKRARQNVVFEHGFLNAKLGRKNVCALIKDDVEVPNDISGLVYIIMDSNGAWKLSLAKEMKNSGLEVDMNLAI